MKEELLNIIDRLYKRGEYQHILLKYVNNNYWMEKINVCFSKWHIENSTDFNYSTCFTMNINISCTDAHVGTKAFTKYIKDTGELYRVQIQISALAPFATYKFIKYIFDNGEIKMSESFAPFLQEHYTIAKYIDEFLLTSGLVILDEELLSINVPGVSLEMRESEVTVYHCLFEDGY